MHINACGFLGRSTPHACMNEGYSFSLGTSYPVAIVVTHRKENILINIGKNALLFVAIRNRAQNILFWDASTLRIIK
jgi:hypothetical protein